MPYPDRHRRRRRLLPGARLDRGRRRHRSGRPRPRSRSRCEEIIERQGDAWPSTGRGRRARTKDEREFKILQSSPTLFWPELNDEPFRTWAVEFASALMRRPARVLVRPVPRQAAGRRACRRCWHQDEGYWGRNLDDRGHHLLDAVPRRRPVQRLHALHRRRPPRRRARAPSVAENVQSDLLVLRTRRVPRRRLPARGSAASRSTTARRRT